MHVSSPYEGRRLGVLDHLSISGFWFGSNVLWAAMLLVIIPKQMEIMKGKDAALYNGNLVGIGALIALVVPLVVGVLSDRCQHPKGRRRPYIAWGVVINIAGLALLFLGGQSGHFINYLAGYLLLQLGNNIATGAFSGIIPDLVPADQRGIASGYMGLLSTFGSAVGAILASILIGKNVMLAYLLLGVVLVLSASFTIFGTKENALEGESERLSWKEYLKGLWIDPKKFPDFAWVWATRAMVMLGFYAIQPNIQYYLRDMLHLEDAAAAAGKMFLLVLIAATVTGILGGWLSDRVGRKRIVYLANALMALMAVAFPMCGTLSMATIVAVIFGLGYGAYISVDWALGTDVLPNKADAGKDMAVWHIAMVLPQSVAAPVAGIVLSAFGTKEALVGKDLVAQYQPGGYFALFGFAALMLGLGAFFLRNVKGSS